MFIVVFFIARIVVTTFTFKNLGDFLGFLCFHIFYIMETKKSPKSFRTKIIKKSMQSNILRKNQNQSIML